MERLELNCNSALVPPDTCILIVVLHTFLRFRAFFRPLAFLFAPQRPARFSSSLLYFSLDLPLKPPSLLRVWIPLLTLCRTFAPFPVVCPCWVGFLTSCVDLLHEILQYTPAYRSVLYSWWD